MKLWIFGSVQYYRPVWTTKRGLRFLWQKLTRGFSDDHVWCLDYTIAKFSLPRLRRLREWESGSPGCYTHEQWWGMVDKMIWSMNEIVTNEGSYPEEEPPNFSEEGMIESDCKRRIYYQKLHEGLVLFGRNFRGLWL